MKVILRQDIDTLGDKNEVKNVAAGYARNYLIPRGVAVEGNAQNLKDLERRLLFEKRREAKLEKELSQQAGKIKGARLELTARSGAEGKLYGSISAKEIAAALTEKFKFEFDKKRVRIADPIRRLGEHAVSVRLAENVTVDIVIVVTPDANSDAPAPKEPEVAEAAAAEEAAAPEEAEAAE